MKADNADHKKRRTEAKLQQREMDVKICNDYIELVNKQEQKKIDDLQKRE